MRVLSAFCVALVMAVVVHTASRSSVPAGEASNAGTGKGEAKTKADKISVLIVDGFSNHDWKKTTELIRGVLEPTGLFRVDVSTAPPQRASEGWDKWRPHFQDYNVVLQNSNDIGGGPSWPKEVQSAFENYVREGGGVFIFHSANNAFPNWPAYDDIIGLGWRNKNQGVALSIRDEDQSVVKIPVGEGGNTGHGPRIDAVLTRIGNHPIHEGLPKRWKTPGLEVYYHARGPAKDLTVLSYTLDPKTKMNWPIEWVVNHGKGRVYNSTFGHVWKGDDQPPSMRCVGVQTVMVRALQWLARKPVAYPVPADFPTDTKLLLRAKIG